jgi:uncharacterized membrane protein YfcA
MAVPAVVLVGLAKGGFAGAGSLALPLMALVISPVRAAAILLPVLIVQDAISVIAYRRTWDGWNLSVLLPGAAIGIFVGYLLARHVSNSAIELTVGMISISFAVRQLSIISLEAPSVRPSILAGWFFGAFSGFTSMIAHAGAPPFQIFVVPQKLPRDVFIGTSVLFFAAVNLAKTVPYIALGQLSQNNLEISIMLMPVAVMSTLLGVYAARRIPLKAFFRTIYCLMLLVGMKLSYDGVMGLA